MDEIGGGEISNAISGYVVLLWERLTRMMRIGEMKRVVIIKKKVYANEFSIYVHPYMLVRIVNETALQEKKKDEYKLANVCMKISDKRSVSLSLRKLIGRLS